MSAGHDQPSNAQLWEEYRRTRERDLRNQLMLRYASLVRNVVYGIRAGLPPQTAVCDLESHGMLGLLEAVERFDYRQSVQFETYATHRIRGAVMDELRRLDWAPRSLRDRAKAIDESRATLSNALGRTPTMSELATAMGITVGALRRSMRIIESLTVGSLDGDRDWRNHRGREPGLKSREVVDPSQDPAQLLEEKESRRLLADGLTRLSQRERDVLSLSFVERKTLVEISQFLGVTEGRVSQIRARSLERLRDLLKAERAG